MIKGYGFEKAVQDLKDFEFIIHDNSLKIFTESCEEILPKVLQILYKNNVEVRSISIERSSLEDVFVDLIRSN